MTDDRTAPEPDGAPAQPTAPLPAAPQTWPSPSPDAAQPAWGSPAGPVGEPGAPEWARPAEPQAAAAAPSAPAYGPPTTPVFGAPAQPPSYGTPPAYPYGPPAGYPYPGGQPAYGTPPGRRSGVSAGLVAAVVVAALVAVGGLVAGLFAVSTGGDDDASGPVVPAPSFAPPSPEASGGPAPGLTPRTTAPAPRVPSPTSAAGTAYVQQANAYCRATTDPDLKALAPLQATDPAKYLRSAAKVNRELDDRLRKDVPKELSSTVGRITASWDALSDGYEKAADAFEKGDAQAFQRHLEDAQAANERGNDLAKQIGMNDCADAGGIGGTPGGAPATPGTTV